MMWYSLHSAKILAANGRQSRMATRHLGALVSRRDIWIAAAELDMRDAPETDVARVSFLISACGKTPAEAKAEVSALRRRPDTSKDQSVFTVNLPEEWLHSLKPELAGLSSSELIRYVLAYIVDNDHEDAISNAKRKRGRPRKNQAATA